MYRLVRRRHASRHRQRRSWLALRYGAERRDGRDVRHGGADRRRRDCRLRDGGRELYVFQVQVVARCFRPLTVICYVRRFEEYDEREEGLEAGVLSDRSMLDDG